MTTPEREGKKKRKKKEYFPYTSERAKVSQVGASEAASLVDGHALELAVRAGLPGRSRVAGRTGSEEIM